MKKPTVILLIVFFFSFSSLAEQLPHPIAKVPFQFKDRIVIPVKAKNSRELEMIFDTGTPNKDTRIFKSALAD